MNFFAQTTLFEDLFMTFEVVFSLVRGVTVLGVLFCREGRDGDEGSDGDFDLFPFDPKDATEPVEV